MIARVAWGELGLPADSDASAVRQAYAALLRAMDPDADPAGFARLRAARDAALADIRRRAASTPPALNDPFAAAPLPEPAPIADAPKPQAPWPQAAPTIERPVPPGQVTSTGMPALPAPPPLVGAASGPSSNPIAVATTPFGAPELTLAERGDVLADRGRGAALETMLLAAEPTEPLDDAGERQALDHLAALLRIAHRLPIEQSRAAEDTIARLLVRTWPRSAPLLAPASAAFGWDREHGQIGERADIRFLNARRRGLRFVEQVEQPGHVYHRAWAELSKPGFKRSWGVKQAEIKALLEGVRKNFPEVEHYLDPQRIGAWEAKVYAPSTAGLGGLGGLLRRLRGLMAFVIGIQIVIAIGHALTSQQVATTLPWSVHHFVQNPADPAKIVLNKAATHWFGPDMGIAEVERHAPEVAALAASNAGGTSDATSADQAMRDAVFATLHRTIQRADHRSLRAVQRLRLQVSDQANRVGPGACMDFLIRNRVDDGVVLSHDQQDAARGLIRAFADGPMQGKTPPRQRLTAVVSGSMIGWIKIATRLPSEQVQAALRHLGSDTVQCAVQRALLTRALQQPAAIGDPILRVE